MTRNNTVNLERRPHKVAVRVNRKNELLEVEGDTWPGAPVAGEASVKYSQDGTGSKLSTRAW